MAAPSPSPAAESSGIEGRSGSGSGSSSINGSGKSDGSEEVTTKKEGGGGGSSSSSASGGRRGSSDFTLVFEDDVELEEGFMDRFGQAIRELEDYEDAERKKRERSRRKRRRSSRRKVASFQASTTYAGSRNGFVFKSEGDQGAGYYSKDTPPEEDSSSAFAPTVTEKVRMI